MLGRVGAGQMRHHEARLGAQNDRRDGFPFARFHAEPVHACVELHAKGRAGQGLEMPGDLFERVEHRDQAKIADHVRIARHMPGKHKDFRPFSDGLTQCHALFCDRYEELARPRAHQRPCHPIGAQPIAVGLDHRARFRAGARGRVQRAPVGDDCVEVDTKRCVCHGDFVERAAPEVKRKGAPGRLAASVLRPSEGAA